MFIENQKGGTVFPFLIDNRNGNLEVYFKLVINQKSKIYENLKKIRGLKIDTDTDFHLTIMKIILKVDSLHKNKFSDFDLTFLADRFRNIFSNPFELKFLNFMSIPHNNPIHFVANYEVNEDTHKNLLQFREEIYTILSRNCKKTEFEKMSFKQEERRRKDSAMNFFIYYCDTRQMFAVDKYYSLRSLGQMEINKSTKNVTEVTESNLKFSPHISLLKSDEVNFDLNDLNNQINILKSKDPNFNLDMTLDDFDKFEIEHKKQTINDLNILNIGPEKVTIDYHLISSKIEIKPDSNMDIYIYTKQNNKYPFNDKIMKEFKQNTLFINKKKFFYKLVNKIESSPDYIYKYIEGEGYIKDINIESKGGESTKILPEINNDISLREYGYSLHNNKLDRQKSLIRASKKEGSLPILRRLILISNYSKSEKDNFQKYRKDIKFLKDLYKINKF
jgi:hypothetical protein